MSAEILRQAAALMRERAVAATADPWSAEAIGSEGFHVFGPEGSRAPMRGRARVAACTWQDWEEAEADAEHIASWHPAVALAVATWLDSHADIHALRTCDERLTVPCPALSVARAYLGEQP